MEKYGFIYLWYDSYRKMYYLGCHWGYENDGYICSSNRMRDAYRRRPHDFKRRIIDRIDTNRVELLEKEYRWLSLITNDELGKKYYNHSKRHFGHWSTDEYLKERTLKKLHGNTNRLGKQKSYEEIEKIRKALTGRKRSKESIEKQSKYWSGRKRDPEIVKKIAESNKGQKRKIVTCPHCNKSGGINAMAIHHFERCKFKTKEIL